MAPEPLYLLDGLLQWLTMLLTKATAGDAELQQTFQALVGVIQTMAQKSSALMMMIAIVTKALTVCCFLQLT
jgi:hypothetical protein